MSSRDQRVRVLLEAAGSAEPFDTMDQYYTMELIKALQRDERVDHADLIQVEMAYLPLFLSPSRDKDRPIATERELAADPQFFHALMGRAFRPVGAPPDTLGEGEQRQAADIWRLLMHHWAYPPGWQREGGGNEESWKQWLREEEALCRESGHDIGLMHEIVGACLARLTLELSDEDAEVVWYDEAFVHTLEGDSDMQRGYRVGITNARGVHFVDHSGGEERKLAEKCRARASWLDTEGYPSFAQIWRSLAEEHEKEARLIVERFGAGVSQQGREGE